MFRSLPFLAAAAVVLASTAGCDVARPVSTGTSATVVCTSCHGDDARLEDDPLVRAAPPAAIRGGDPGAHLAHLRGGAFRGPIPCGECHAVPTSSRHADGTVDLAFGDLARARGATPAWTDPTCSSVYCHGATLSDGPAATPAWTAAASVGCGSCHGAPPSSHDPSATRCNACHPGTVKASGELDLAGGLHLDGELQVAQQHPAGWAARDQHGFAANARGLAGCKACHGAALEGSRSAPSCTACHASAGQPGWATSCTFCHGDRAAGRASPPVDTQGKADAGRVSVGAHAAHVATTLAAPLACDECHPARAGSVVDDPAHLDGDATAEIAFGARARSGGAAATYARADATLATCSSVYCHGEFTGGTRAAPSWTSGAKVTCASCHASRPSTRRHGDHGDFSCAECHGHGGTGATHVNGRRDVPFSSAAPGAAWNPATRSCGSFACHGESHSASRTW